MHYREAVWNAPTLDKLAALETTNMRYCRLNLINAFLRGIPHEDIEQLAMLTQGGRCCGGADPSSAWRSRGAIMSASDALLKPCRS
jgi:hypothetical protein